MKLQHLIIIFLVIALPLALIMSQYTSLQIDILAKKTQYDTALLGATFDTMAAFELNTVNSKSSSVIGEEIRDIEAIISTFTNSLSSSINIAGVSNDYILSYVPAMVFTMYDGYYIYSVSGTGNTTNRELKPYVYYTKTYINTNTATNITIAFSLDNYVSIYGKYKDLATGTMENVSAAGYLVVPGDVDVSNDFAYVTTTKEDGSVGTKVIKSGGLKYKGKLIEKETIYENKTVKETSGIRKDQLEETTDAIMYYYEAKQFTELYNKVVSALNPEDKKTLKITNESDTYGKNDPEDETSRFMNEKVNVIKDSITRNLNAAIYNYEGGVAAENYEMPQLNGEDWDKILNNISIIVFLKDIPIGNTSYNNYVVVNSTTNQKYVSSKSIDFISYQGDDSTGYYSTGYYHKITCDDLKEEVNNNPDLKLVGYASVDFERYKYAPDDINEYYYYYKHNEYADYGCEVNSIETESVATIASSLPEKLLKSYYSAVGRIRYRLVKASSYINFSDASKMFAVKYLANGGQFSDSERLDEDGNLLVSSEHGKIRINQEGVSKTGKSFLGWSINSDATTLDVKDGDTLYLEHGKELNLYAVWSS